MTKTKKIILLTALALVGVCLIVFSNLTKDTQDVKNETDYDEYTKYLEEKRKPLWVRHVVLPGYTDDKEDLTRLGEFIGGLKNLHALDVLPYHTLGVSKYAELGIEYPLEGKPSATAADAARAKRIILEAIKRVRGGTNA